MIDARELRLGNYVLVDGVIKEIFGIGPAGVDFVVATPSKSVKIDGCIYEHLCPIPLSAAILEGCGGQRFANHENPMPASWEINSDEWFPYLREYSNGFVVVFGEENEIPIESLHQLQNIYFSLTGEELAVDPKKL